MSCLDNTDILRIVGGNSFQIAITVKARRVSDGSEIEDFDLSASSPVLNLIHAGEKTRKYFVTQDNQAIISFDGSEGLGYYGMEMSGSYNSEAWRFCIEKVLQLVDTNAKANIPGWSVLVDDTYFVEGTISIYGGGGGGDTMQADWAETNPTSAAFILHKPDLSVYATKTEVASGLAGKQDTIVDLTSIRYGAAAGAAAYQKPASGIPESDMSEGVQSALNKADSSYQKPSGGIPSTDMSEGVQAALEKANSAVQTETDPVFSNSPAAEITQADINNWNAKQSAIVDLADIREGAAAGATAVQPDEMAQAIDGVEGDIEDINAKIPTAASSLNQLADKAYVNSSIATNSATYRGSFNLITDLGMNVDATHAQIAGALATAITTADNNDYAFVQIPDSASTPTVIAKIERYKHNGSGWVYEYDLNNSGFTSAQWAAINSGITSGLVGKLADLPNNSELATLLNGKQNVISDLSAIRSGAAAGATAVQPADLTEALNGVEDEIAGLDESKQDVIEDLATIRSGAAAGATAYQKPSSGIPESDMSEGVQSALDKAENAYQLPANGIPATDMDSEVQASLEKANSAVQTETDPVFSGSPAAEITQTDINNWNAKQSAIADLADIREGAAAGATAVQPDEMAQAIDEVEGDIADINAKIPTAASSLNQLADKAYVNSSIATNSATYRGSFNLITDLGMNVDATHAQIAGALATSITTADNNDYAFVQIPDSASTPTVIAKIERYKHNGSGWVYEYDLNNSGFTAAQWAAINSGITSGLVGKLADLPNNSELATLLNGKQNVINDLATIRSGAAAGATAIQQADLTEALNGVEAEIAGLDESKQDVIEDLSTIRSGASAGATAYQKPSSGIPESDMSDGVQSALDKAEDAYQLPANGIPSTDMDSEVQASLEKANSAVQTETDPVFSNSPAAEITQADINNWNAKQSAIADLADIREGAAAGATAVQPDEMAQAIDEVDGDIADINEKIPTAASNLNQLADKAYVNSSIATNSATYRGSFNLITDLGMNVDATHAQIAGALATAIVTADNNDYAFVQIPDSASTPTVIAKIERYKHNGSGWVYEYDLNNSGFTAAQWAAINSGITSGLVGKLADLPNNSELATLLNGKQNVINDLSAIRSGASAGATAYQKPSSGIPASDMSSTVQQELSKANTAVQTETDPIFSASPAAGITAQNIQTWNGEPAARQAADAALQTAIQDEAAARIAADALKVNKADVQDINSVAEPMTSTTNPISAHAMGVMKAYVDAEVSQTIITPTDGSVVADNATIESTEIETNVHQLSVKSGVFWTKGTNDVEEKPAYLSEKIVKSGGLYSDINGKTAYDIDLMSHFLSGCYINTSGAVGSVVDITSPVSGPGWGCIAYLVKSGQPVQITGSGGNGPRLWCFTDVSKKIISQADASISATNVVLLAPEDGYFVYNTALTNNDRSCVLLYGESIKDRLVSMSNEIGEINESLTETENVVAGKTYNLGGVSTSGGAFKPDGTTGYSSSGFVHTDPIFVSAGSVLTGVIRSTDTITPIAVVSSSNRYIGELRRGVQGDTTYDVAIYEDCYISVSCITSNLEGITISKGGLETKVEDVSNGILTQILDISSVPVIMGGFSTEGSINTTSGLMRTLPIRVVKGSVFSGKYASASTLSLISEVQQDGTFVKSLLRGINGTNDYAYTFMEDAYVSITLSVSDHIKNKGAIRFLGDIEKLSRTVLSFGISGESKQDLSTFSDFISGFWKSDGSYSTSTQGFDTIQNIKVSRGDIFYGFNVVSTDIIAVVSEVDENNNFISTILAGSMTTRNRSCIIQHDCYINISVTSANHATIGKMFLLRRGTITTLNKLSSKYVGLKYAALGDSITARNHWQEITDYLTGMEHKTLACSGMLFGGFAFHYPNGLNSQSSDRLLSSDDFADCACIVICGYANNMYANSGAGTPIGTMSDQYVTISEEGAEAASSIDAYRQSITAQNFIPQARSVIEWVLKQAQSARVIIAGQLQMSSSQRPGWHITNGNGHTTEDYSEALRTVANWYGLPYIDLEHNGGVNSLNWSTFYDTENDVHPNYKAFDGSDFPASGMKRMGEVFAGKIKEW